MAGSKKSKSKLTSTDDGFLMSPKIDFVFKLIFEDEKARMLYDAREAELRDQLTRMKSEKDKGRAEVAKNFLDMGFEIPKVALATGLSEEEVKRLRDN